MGRLAVDPGVLILWAPAPALVLANLGLRRSWSPLLVVVLADVVAVMAGVAAIVLGSLGAAAAPRAAARAVSGPDATLVIGLATILVVVLCLVPWVRRQLARAIPIQVGNPVHTLALQLCAVMLGFASTAFLASDPLASTNYTSEDVPNLVLSEAPFAGLALLGVGLLVRRDLPQTFHRLGLVRPRLRHLALALVVAQLLILLAIGDDLLSQWLTPDLNRRVGEVSKKLYEAQSSNVLFWTVLSLSAGVCEEILFRGALQPRFGIPLTSALFTLSHVQYGITLTILIILVSAVVLGLIRKYTNTTTSIACHATYDGLSSLLPGLPAWAATLFFLLLVAQVIGLLAYWGTRLAARRSFPGYPPPAPVLSTWVAPSPSRPILRPPSDDGHREPSPPLRR